MHTSTITRIVTPEIYSRWWEDLYICHAHHVTAAEESYTYCICQAAPAPDPMRTVPHQAYTLNLPTYDQGLCPRTRIHPSTGKGYLQVCLVPEVDACMYVCMLVKQDSRGQLVAPTPASSMIHEIRLYITRPAVMMVGSFMLPVITEPSACGIRFSKFNCTPSCPTHGPACPECGFVHKGTRRAGK